MGGVTCWNERVINLRSWHRTTVPPPFGTAKRAIARAPRIPAPLLMFWIVTWQSLTLSLSNPCFYKAVICHDIHAKFGTRIIIPSISYYGLWILTRRLFFFISSLFLFHLFWMIQKTHSVRQRWNDVEDFEPILSRHLVEVYFLLGYDIFFGKNFRGLFCSKQIIAGYVNEVSL